MPDPELWALMQRIETCRYRAECVERAWATRPEPWRSFSIAVAAQWRQLAEQVYALSQGEALPPILTP